jgi:hypothetical protein
MTERQWKGWQNDLKKLHDSQPDGPQDPNLFKQRVLQEYRKRAQTESRSKWATRAVTGLTAAAAVWVGLMITHPNAPAATETRKADSGTTTSSSMPWSDPKSSQSLPSLQKESLDRGLNPAAADTLGQKQKQDAGPEQVVREFFDLLLQKRVDDTKTLMTEKMKGSELPIQPNAANPHMTGYTVVLMKQGDAEQRYAVDLTWTNMGGWARTDTFEVVVRKENNAWRVAEVVAGQSFSYSVDDHDDISLQILQYKQTDERKVFMKRGQLRDPGPLTGFTVNPRNAFDLLFAIQKEKPTLYSMQDGGEPRKLAALPPGKIGDVIWTEDGRLVINFTPQGTALSTILLYDAKTGNAENLLWLTKLQEGAAPAALQAQHALPDGRVRVSMGGVSLLLDLAAQTLVPDTTAAQPLQQLKYDRRGVNLPSSELLVYTADQKDTAPVLNIPEAQKLDPNKETGLYVLNGYVLSTNFNGQTLQVVVGKEPGREQAVAVPYEMLKSYQGRTVTLELLDTDGNALAKPRAVGVPAAR